MIILSTARRIGALAAARWVVGLLSFTLLTACGGVVIHPTPVLPKPLIQPIPASVGLIIPPDMRNFTHKETRWGVNWQVALGPGHVRLMHDVFSDSFTQVEEFQDLQSARAASNLKALFEPRIDQYSFVTARETGGRYYAVTIRYRIDLYTPTGEKSDTLTLTGYGNALAKGMSSSKPLVRASIAAMRDAAAKFLVQFPDQPAGQALAHNEALAVEKTGATADNSQIEAVPIDEPELAVGTDASNMKPVTSAAGAPGPTS
jgi:hypothetical protein